MRNTALKFSSIIIVAVLAGCAHQQSLSTPAAPPPLPVAPDSVAWFGDPEVAPILIHGNITPYIEAGAERVEERLGMTEFQNRLGAVAEDTTAPWIVRVNALKLLADRGALDQLPVFNEALHDSQEVVRLSAVNDMRQYMAVNPEAATEFLVAALMDPSTRVQGTALQLLGDRDMDALRAFAKRAQNGEMRKVAVDVIQAAEERGAPLMPKDSLGTLERTTSNGTVLTFKPTERWKNWDAAVGDVLVKLPGKKPALIASGVEEVGNVVPAFFNSDYNTLVYEQNREVHARNLLTGEDRKLADGIAPRVLPFSNDVIYMSEIRGKRIETPNSVGLKYDVMRIPLAGGTATSIGQIGDKALNDLKGNYASVRWARIRETEGTFELVGDQIEPFRLPSPFGQ